MLRKLRNTEKPCKLHRFRDWILLWDYWYRESPDPIIAQQQVFYWHCPLCNKTAKQSINHWHIQNKYLRNAIPMNVPPELKKQYKHHTDYTTSDNVEIICNKLTSIFGD